VRTASQFTFLNFFTLAYSDAMQRGDAETEEKKKERKGKRPAAHSVSPLEKCLDRVIWGIEREGKKEKEKNKSPSIVFFHSTFFRHLAFEGLQTGIEEEKKKKKGKGTKLFCLLPFNRHRCFPNPRRHVPMRREKSGKEA